MTTVPDGSQQNLSCLPKAVRRQVGVLHRATGDDITVLRPGPLLWRVLLDNGRIRLTVDYVSKGGKVGRAGSTLAVDGRDRPLAADLIDFMRIYRAHPVRRGDGDDTTAKVAQPHPIPDGGDLAGMPMAVRVIYDVMRDRVPDLVQAGRGGGKWVVGISVGDTHARFIWTQRGGRWNRRQQIISHGTDMTYALGAEFKLEVILKWLGVPDHGAGPGPGPIAGTAPGQGLNSVGVRKTIVRRV